MFWWGKIIGGAVGALLGPMGAVAGVILGHMVDKGLDEEAARRLSPEEQAQLQTAFFTATFNVMGQVAKSDGYVSESELQAARSVMDSFGLNEAQRLAAMRLFNAGKEGSYDISSTLAELKTVCQRRRPLLQLFMEIQFQAAYANVTLLEPQATLLTDIGIQLGFSELELRSIALRVRAEREFAAWFASMHGDFSSQQGYYQQGYHQQQQRANDAGPTGPDPYAVLGIDKTASDAEVKRAYRRLMSQHHPDKLMSKGLPEEMMKLATAKAQEIKAAYETICKWRGK